MRVGGPLSGSGSVAAEMRAANRLIESIQENTVLSRRDRAIIGVIGYAWVPIHGIAGMKVRDYYQLGESRWVRWTDHGTEHRDLLVPRLVRLLDEYVEAAGIADDSWGPLFRSSNGHNLGPRRMSVEYVAKMIRDRHEEAERLDQLSKRLNRIRMRRERRKSTRFSVGGS